MQMSAGLFQQQVTSLTMTQGLAQAISLLQFSTAELTDFIQEKSLENPLLEMEDHDPKDIIVDRDFTRNTTFRYEEQDKQLSPLDFLTRKGESLREHLIRQLRLLNLSEHIKKQVQYFIYHVNENGYLTEDVEELCLDLKITSTEGREILSLLQSLEPVGVGARNLQECLLLQLKRSPEKNELAEMIVAEYMEDFANKRWKIISNKRSISLEEIQKVHDVIQQLQPRPGSSFSHDVPEYIAADVSVIEVDGELVVSVNDELIPKIQFQAQYKSLLKDKEINSYIKEKYHELQWLIKSVNHRQLTLYRVAKAIVEKQRDFFYKGSESLKPLSLKDIAEELEVHESTVSRITSNKYMETPQGIFELKHFFTHSLYTSSSTAGSTTASHIKKMMKQVIDQENKLKPLSDQKIVHILAEEHSIELSRRVIAKYRDELNIPSSSKRKRFAEGVG
ncbi:RNA polymerase factor sigma-54 [Bacillus sp. AFS040349]|uniref:RNA polymerase factor sigma-54 n=1 Tax=Bacillus sp. AFS040349 TaxID=2033502 RepID=UPI0021003B26|nr:RNA polymerase factor sigma-54 [Bacillus sp. AFS040349]